MRKLLGLKVSLASLGLVACGGADTSPPAETDTAVAAERVEAISAAAHVDKIDWRSPCNALKDSDLDAVFPGVSFDASADVEDTLETLGTANGVCRYNARAFRAEDAYLVTITLGAWTNPQNAYQTFASVTAPVQEGIEILDGFAEGGAYVQMAEKGMTTFMYQGTVFEVEVQHDARATYDGHDPSIELARRLAARL